MNVVTRFAPSPTGFMHIGNARTALFNWLFARRHGGRFLLRIEDTDRKRHSEEAVQAILSDLDWLGLDYDGAPVSQHGNRARHVEIAEKLLAEDKAYKCYCTPEELEEMRAEARKAGKTVFYDRRWRDRNGSDSGSDSGSGRGMPGNGQPVIRIKAPLEGETTLNDHVQGRVSVKNENLDDFIILRSDGSPTFMLAVVVDDYDMGITHVIRGDDHLNNSFRQNILYDALGWDRPHYAHIPLIHGADGAKFSKRHGAQSVDEYRLMGFLPEALKNYLLRLGWSRGNEEIIPTDKALEWFGLEGINKAAARFDPAKLENLNGHYIKEETPEALCELLAPFLIEDHRLEISSEGRERLLKGMEHLKQRGRTLVQMAEEAAFYLKQTPFPYDEKAAKTLDKDATRTLKALLEAFAELPDFSETAIEQSCRDLSAALQEGKLGKVAMPLRAALTGSSASPPIFHAASILGRSECEKRLRAAIDWIESR